MKMVRKPGPRDGWYEIGPGDAQEILDGKAPNRPLSEHRALRYASAMRAGQWAENGEPWIFDDRDSLLDAQTRARAVVLSGKTIVAYCIFGIPRRFFSTLDDGAKRTGADAASCAGVKNAVIAAAAARWLMRYETGSPADKRQTFSNKVITDKIRRTPDLEEAVSAVVRTKTLISIIPPSTIAFVYLMAHREDPRAADTFIEQLASGENLSSGDAVLVLRQRLLSLRGQTHKAHEYEKLAWTIKAWNAHRAHRKLSLLKWVPKIGSKRAEAFPRFGGDEVNEEPGVAWDGSAGRGRRGVDVARQGELKA